MAFRPRLRDISRKPEGEPEPADLAGLARLSDHPAVLEAQERLDKEREHLSRAESNALELSGRLARLRGALAHPDDVDEIERLEGLIADGRGGLEKARLRVDLARRVLRGAQAQQAELARAAFLLAYRVAALRLDECLRAAASANRELLQIFAAAEDLRGQLDDSAAMVSVLPALHWPELLEPVGSMGETRYHAWRLYVGQELDLDLDAPESA